MTDTLSMLRRQALRPVTGQCVGAGILFGLAFPSHPGHPLAFLFHPVWAWICLVPLLLAVRGAAAPASAFRRAWVAGAVGNLICLYWVGNTSGGGPAVVAGAGLGAAYLGLFTGLFGWMLRRLVDAHGSRALLLAPVLWTAVEYLMSLGELGFPWLLLGHSQAGWPALIQVASLTGAYGVSFAVAAVNACLAVGITDPGRRAPAFLSAAAILFVLGGAGWARMAMSADPPNGDRADNTASVALIQNGIGREKWAPGGLLRSLSSLDSLSRAAIARRPVDLVVWPEMAVPCRLATRADCREPIGRLADEFGVAVLTGAPDRDPQTREPMNGVFYRAPGEQTLHRYAKMHMVPFGERTPFLDAIPFLRDVNWAALTGDLAPAQFARGRERTMFPLNRDGTTYPVAPLVCFESVFPDLVRRHVATGAALLVIVTNDSWFGATSGPFQHAQIAAMRAVENRRAVARCATNGVSLFVDPLGRSRQATAFGTADVRVDDVTLAATTDLTLYTRFGDWFPQLCLILGAAALWMTRHTMRSR